ncbi:cilia- and flagella-associated protein 53-like [Eurosta solidaginis]|uniref:cilia- and flagella-associated protein 53-like n=1 Tax=Eurosta solidaginis TaxID=178769 RepID=UPI0035314C44
MLILDEGAEMEAIKFLEHTNYKNLNFKIKSKVQENLRRLNGELVDRSFKLRHILEYENLKYAEEIALVMKARTEEAARKRHEYFGIQRMERGIEIANFLELKKLQREMENCEETRHKQSKALLLETKQAQLYQVKEKELMRQKERDIEAMWEEVTRRYNEEMVI